MTNSDGEAVEAFNMSIPIELHDADSQQEAAIELSKSFTEFPDSELRRALFNERDKRVRREASSAIIIAGKHQKIERLESALIDAETDPATGLPTRAVFERDFAAIVRRKAWVDPSNPNYKSELGTPTDIVIGVGDLKGLKRVNDGYSHAEGDSYLNTTAAAISSSLRQPNDRLYRWGGDEVAFILQDVDVASEPIEEITNRTKAVVQNRLQYPPELHTGLYVGMYRLKKGESPDKALGEAMELLKADKDKFHAALPKSVLKQDDRLI